MYSSFNVNFSSGDHLKPDAVGNDEADGGEVGDKPEDDVYSADDAAPSETTNTDSDSNMSSLNNSTMVIPTSNVFFYLLSNYIGIFKEWYKSLYKKQYIFLLIWNLKYYLSIPIID